MGTKREEYRLRGGDILEIREFHDGRYGAPGQRREKKKKPTEEQMRQANEREKIRRCQLRMMTYFHEGDCLATLTYRQDKRPPNMKEALKDFQKTIRKVRKEYQKRGYELFWIRNIERGTKGAWHIHIVLNEIGDTASILQQVWGKGGVWSCEIKNSQFYSEDFYQLASYLTKSEHRIEHKSNGDAAKPRLKETSYNTSRNMPLPEPKIQKLVRWQEEAKPRKGYYIAKIYEGYNPVTGYKYRQYTMIRLERRRTDYDGDRRLRRDKHKRTAGKKRKWGYVLEAPGGRTVYQLGEMTGTMHGITLQVLIKALRRYQKPSRITIHAADEWVLQMLLRQLSAWEQNGFTNAKGESIKYRSGWEQLANLIKMHTITIAPGRHAYSAWLQSEMEKMERGK